MATGLTKVRKAVARSASTVDPVGGRAVRRLDTQLERKGFFPAANIAKSLKEAKASQAEQKQAIGVQQQRELLSLAETGSDISRRRLLGQTGGRRSLIASR